MQYLRESPGRKCFDRFRTKWTSYLTNDCSKWIFNVKHRYMEVTVKGRNR